MEIRDYIAPLIKWWWLILVAIVVSTVTSVFVTSQQPSQYEAKATLMIGNVIEDPNPTNTQFTLGQQLATTYADIAYRQPIQFATIEALGLQESGLPNYNVRPVANTQLLEIVVTDTDPARAAAVANELANQLIDISATNAQGDASRLEFINSQLDDLEADIQETQNEILIKQEELGGLTSARDIEDAQTQIAALRSKLNSLQTNYSQLLATTQAEAVNTLSIIEPAIPPDLDKPVGPNVPLTALTAAGIGLLLSASAAFLLEYLDNTVKSPVDIARLTSLPMLTGIAYIKGEQPNEKLVTIHQPRSPVSEAYRKLRTGIQFASIDSPNRTSVLITSTNPSEGKSVTAANLAIVIAQAHNRVLLVDADLRRPSLHRVFEVPNSRGLTTFLLKMKPHSMNGEADDLLNQVIEKSPVEGLSIMTSGPIPPNPSELLGSTKMHEALKYLTEKFDYVVVDSPPVMAVTDAVVLSTQVDSVLVVTEAGRTQRTPLKQTVENLRNVKANLVGVVLNRLSSRGDGYGYYYYYRNAYYFEDGSGGTTGNGAKNGGLLKNLLPKKTKDTIGE
jgi:non-specific protein-tyrosine kinase